MPDRPRLVGLTGGIGAGKSEALAALERLGAATLSTDAVVHQLYADPEVVAAVVDRWGAEVAPGLTLTVLGGAVRPGSMSTMGPLAEASLRRLTADKAVVSGDGFVAGRGLCEAAIEQVALKSLMMEQAAEVVVLMDSSKLGRATQGAWAPLPRRWTLVTDAGAPQAQCAAAEAAGARVVRAAG